MKFINKMAMKSILSLPLQAIKCKITLEINLTGETIQLLSPLQSTEKESTLLLSCLQILNRTVLPYDYNNWQTSRMFMNPTFC